MAAATEAYEEYMVDNDGDMYPAVESILCR
jgi:hypothetical protein